MDTGNQVNIESGKWVVLFDGVCNLCNGSVNFIIDNDPTDRFRFMALQDPRAESVVGHNLPPIPESLIVVVDGKNYYRSSGALKIASGLWWPYKIFCIFWLVPRPLRDWVYNVLAKQRYTLFGKKDSCRIPTPELKQKFL